MSDTIFISASSLAVRLGVPVSFIQAEAEARRIPSLKIGNKLRFNPALVEQVLLERSAAGVQREPQEPQEVTAHA